MPEKIMRAVGLKFTKKELEELLGTELDFSDIHGLDMEMAVDYLEMAHDKNFFAEFGFSNDCYLDEISGDEEGLFMYF